MSSSGGVCLSSGWRGEAEDVGVDKFEVPMSGGTFDMTSSCASARGSSRFMLRYCLFKVFDRMIVLRYLSKRFCNLSVK